MEREGAIERTTRETSVSVWVSLDRRAEPQISTNLPLFSHFLTALTHHSGLAWRIQAEGDVDVDPHHLIEDVGIVMGQAVAQALGNHAGIRRFGQRYLPMDEALVLCALDISGRGRCYWGGAFPDRPINGVSAEVWPEFFQAFAAQAGITLHLRYIAGENAHHVYEAAFKALGKALSEAVALVPGVGIPSTKGVIS
ncbi:Imidazoleglycerol-phosphate dehydratase [Sulfobacillus acidophilus TPY]|uniref:Imidazoleglycerol-phosphate dehydratase n=1 Tax=Sulfobacillus acidophilus (strain ATCC 700253 / DSM 10332 / NAL) TaxID=679936 RepID=G8TXZ1_SULAD|nr:Imidazoleglycerol-phosphate dehydratase [Sulfobacillus acidophilus TPY]AEW06197.1 imidazoleglycerol-phosphate dehydratase [Sulfobacillus acidophilus DSM 10332]